jgi:hypothetical protein
MSIAITTGAPKTAVIELMLISVGANRLLASKSQKRQNTEPPRKHCGIMTTGLDVSVIDLIMCGTAIPTKDIGPAKAVTVADIMLERVIRPILNERILTPTLAAYCSPI